MQLKCETACLFGVLIIILLKIIAKGLLSVGMKCSTHTATEYKEESVGDRKWKSIQCKHLSVS